MSLGRHEIERAKFTFSIYDFEGNDKIDATQLGNALRAMGLTPSLRRISNLGGTRTSNEKTITLEEFLAIYQEAKGDKVEGSYEEYLECLYSYDKDKCGKLSVNQLASLLMGYGEEKLDRDEAEEIILDCGDPYQDEVYYKDFIKNLMKGPDLKIPPALLIQQARAGLGSDDTAAAEEISENENQGRSSTKKQRNLEGNDNDDYTSIKKENASSNNINGSAPSDAADEASLRKKDSVKSTRTRDSVKSNADNDNQDLRRGSTQEMADEKKRDSVKSTRTRDSVKSNADNDNQDLRRGLTQEMAEEKKRDSVKSTRTRDSVKSNADNDDQDLRRGSTQEMADERKRDSVKSNRTRSSVKSNADTEDPDLRRGSVQEASAPAGERKMSRRDSSKPGTASGGSRRGTSPDVSCASEASSTGKDTRRKRSSIQSGTENPDEVSSPDVNNISRKSSRKSITGKRDSVKSSKSAASYDEEGELSPDEDTYEAEMSIGAKSISRTRDSQKSDKPDRAASPDESWASEAAGSEISKSRSSLKVKKGADSGKISPDISAASDATPDVTKSRSSLKSTGSRSSAKSRKSDKKEEEVKAKFQQPLISIKTEGLFGKKKE